MVWHESVQGKNGEDCLLLEPMNLLWHAFTPDQRPCRRLDDGSVPRSEFSVDLDYDQHDTWRLRGVPNHNSAPSAAVSGISPRHAARPESAGSSWSVAFVAAVARWLWPRKENTARMFTRDAFFSPAARGRCRSPRRGRGGSSSHSPQVSGVVAWLPREATPAMPHG